MGWFDDNGIAGYEPVEPPQQPQGTPGAELPPPVEQQAQMPQQAAPGPQFNLSGAQVHGRSADTKDPNDLMWLAQQQPGFDISSTAAAQQTYKNIIQPLFAQQGINANLTGTNSDRINIGGGRTLDFVVGAAGNPANRSFGITDSANPSGGGAGSLGSMGQAQGPGLIDASYGGGGYGGGYGGGGYGGGPQGSGVAYTPMDAPQDYTPQTVQGPAPLSLASITQPGAVTAQQVQGQTAQAGPAVTASTAQGGPAVTAGTVQTGDRVTADRVTSPDALTARNVDDPSGFQNLTAEQLQQDPSYQFRLKQGLGAMQNSAAAKGLLRTGGTLKGLQDYAGESASQEYQAANQRARETYQQNLSNNQSVIGQNNAAQAQAYGLTNQFGQQAQLANQGANLAAGQFNSGQQQQANLANVGNQLQAGMFNSGQAQQGNQFNAGQQQQAGMFNSGQQQQAGQFNAGQNQQAALANQGANLQAGQFNAGMDFNTQQQNIGNQLAAYNAYQPLAQQNAQFNAGQQTAANQQNFANQFAVNQANNAGNLGVFNANLGADLGYGNLALGNKQADQSYGLGLGNLALGNKQADQSYSLGMGNQGLGWANFGLNQQGQQFGQDLSTFNTNYGVFQDNRDTQFNQNLALAGLGQNSAVNYGNQAGGYQVNQGAANGNAGMASAGAWAGALGNIGNMAGQAGAYYDPRSNPRGGQ